VVWVLVVASGIEWWLLMMVEGGYVFGVKFKFSIGFFCVIIYYAGVLIFFNIF